MIHADKTRRFEKQRGLLFVFIGSISLCGLVGIYCLLIGELTDLAGRVLGSTAVIGAASILALAAAIPREQKRWQPIGAAGMITVAVAMTLVLCLIWFDTLHQSQYRYFVKATMICAVAAVALPHVGLLSLARLHRQYGWVRIATIAAIFVLSLLISFVVLFDYEDEFIIRLIGAVAILNVCGTITVPILHRVSAIASHAAIRTTSLEVALTCPRCAASQSVTVGRSKCVKCGLRFRFEIEEEHCQQCGYVVYNIESGVCPECGTPIRHGADSVERQSGGEGI